MTEAEWIETQALILSLWPHARELTADQLRLQHQLVVKVDVGQARQAIIDAAATGREFPPTPGQVVKACQPIGGALPYGEAKQLLVEALSRFGVSGEAAGLRWLAERSPQTARWAASGWRVLATDEIDGEYGGPVDQRWRSDYRSVCERMDSEQAQGRLVPQVSNRIAQIERGAQRRLGSSLRAVDFVGALGGEQQQIEAGDVAAD